jgi:hypothetical protein
MKKSIITLILALVAFAGFAQLTASTSNSQNTVKMKTNLTTSTIDSVVVTDTGSGSLYAGFNVKEPKSIQALIVATSGTVAGTMTLYGSNDGVNWVALTDATSTPTITTYTVTNTGTYAVPQSKVWYLGFHKMKDYKLTWAGTGTMVGRFKASSVIKILRNHVLNCRGF